MARLLVGADRPTAALDTVVLPPRAPQRRHLSWSRARAVFATALLVALVAVLAWLAWPSGSAEPPARSPATPREQAHDLTRWLKQHS